MDDYDLRRYVLLPLILSAVYKYLLELEKYIRMFQGGRICFFHINHSKISQLFNSYSLGGQLNF